jgi:hypothetical protein
LERFAFTIDFGRKELIFSRRAGIDPHMKRSTMARSLPLEPCLSRAGERPIVIGKLGGRRARIFVDTGSTGVAVTARFANLNLRKFSRGRASVNGMMGNQEVKTVEDLSGVLGGFHFVGLHTRILENIPEADALVGIEFLQNFRVTFDYPNRSIVLEPRVTSH